MKFVACLLLSMVYCIPLQKEALSSPFFSKVKSTEGKDYEHRCYWQTKWAYLSYTIQEGSDAAENQKLVSRMGFELYEYFKTHALTSTNPRLVRRKRNSNGENVFEMYHYITPADYAKLPEDTGFGIRTVDFPDKSCYYVRHVKKGSRGNVRAFKKDLKNDGIVVLDQFFYAFYFPTNRSEILIKLPY